MDAKLRDADKIGGKIDSLLNEAEREMGNLEPAKAEELLKEAAELLKEPDLEISPERDMYSSRHAELAPKLESVRAARLSRDIEEAVRNERAEIGPSLQAVKDAAEALGGPKIDEKKVEAVKDAIATLEKALGASDDRRTFAMKDPSFGSYLKRGKSEIDKAKAELAKGEKKLKVVTGPGALKLAAAEDLKKAKGEKDAAKKRERMVAAAAGYAKCATEAAAIGKGGLEKEKVLAAGATQTIEALAEACKKEKDATEKAISKLPKPKPAAGAKKKK